MTGDDYGTIESETTHLLSPKGSVMQSIPHQMSSKSIEKASKKLWIATGLCLTFMTVEVIGGYIAGSLAIMTDAAHLLTDIGGFLISLFSLSMAKKAPTRLHSFGFGRAEILGALSSVAVIWILTGILLYEAFLRGRQILRNAQEEPIEGGVMFVVACIGIVFNVILLSLFHDHGHAHTHEHGHSHSDTKNLNISAAYAHAIGDLIQSFGVAAAGGIIYMFPYPQYPMAQISDPLATVLFSILVLNSTKHIVLDSVGILMQRAPRHIHPEKLIEGLRALDKVNSVHHLHIWSLNSQDVDLSVHLRVSSKDDFEEVLKAAQVFLRGEGISHNTIQLELSECEVPVCYDY